MLTSKSWLRFSLQTSSLLIICRSRYKFLNFTRVNSSLVLKSFNLNGYLAYSADHSNLCRHKITRTDLTLFNLWRTDQTSQTINSIGDSDLNRGNIFSLWQKIFFVWIYYYWSEYIFGSRDKSTLIGVPWNFSGIHTKRLVAGQKLLSRFEYCVHSTNKAIYVWIRLDWRL